AHAGCCPSAASSAAAASAGVESATWHSTSPVDGSSMSKLFPPYGGRHSPPTKTPVGTRSTIARSRSALMPSNLRPRFARVAAGHVRSNQPEPFERTLTVADVIELLEHDHREVEQMFAEYEQASDPKEKRTIVDKIIIELVRHSEAEEQAVYPVIRDHIENGDAIVEHE